MSVVPGLRLANPPIVEAILDVECDLPPGLDLQSLEGRAREVFADRYPTFRALQVQQHEIKAHGEAPPEFNVRRELQALQFWSQDGRQLVQVRSSGFSFNRLAPYSSMDDYRAEIERCWGLFVRLVEPSQVRRIALRYINRILLPTVDGQAVLDQYLALSPRLADEDTLQFVGFVDQHSVREKKTGHFANVILVMQQFEGEWLPIILDIEAMHVSVIDPRDWTAIQSTVDSLRRLSNLIFQRTLTAKCLSLFQQ